ncbi:MAG: glycosyltransferase family 2 protein [Akkermansia sp.]|nr:glycosyltransferase family 2 protein [Akkermansia sp.]
MNNALHKTLTVAIPIYNTALYLEQCLSSVLNEMTPPDVEVLLINDGSTDRSAEIIDSYAQAFPEQTRAIHKENGGWGSCINLAMKSAAGKYFRILDSDDWVSRDYFPLYIKELREINTDAAATEMVEIYSGGRQKIFDIPSGIKGSVSSMSDYIKDGSGFPMGMLTVRTSLLKRGEMEVSERYYSDIEFILKAVTSAKDVYFGCGALYMYRKTDNNASTAQLGYARHRRDFLRMSLHLVQYRSTVGESLPPETKQFFDNDLLRIGRFSHQLYLSPIYHLADVPPNTEELRRWSEELRRLAPELYRKLGKARRKGIPYIWIWRAFNINLYNIIKLWK